MPRFDSSQQSVLKPKHQLHIYNIQYVKEAVSLVAHAWQHAKIFFKVCQLFKRGCGVWISYTIKALRGHFSELNILWCSETNSPYFRRCSLLLFSLILLFGRDFDHVLPCGVVGAIKLEADK